jgi:hybrid cluster-associated redox disulfide protein
MEEREMRITKDMTIEEVVQRFPETIQVFTRHGVVCLGCSAAQYDDLEHGAVVHGLDTQEFLEELNACIGAQT